MANPEMATDERLSPQKVAEDMAALHARNRQESAGLDFSNEDEPWERSRE